uniref:Ig-like domain-containing protein n=1 Tax=Amphimedon queenslandica TaxID=400682 RepID=A0A1X7VQP9_AMPQE
MEPKSCLIFVIVLCAVTAVSCSKNKREEWQLLIPDGKITSSPSDSAVKIGEKLTVFCTYPSYILPHMQKKPRICHDEFKNGRKKTIPPPKVGLYIRPVNSNITLSCALHEKTNPPSKVTFSTTVKETSNVDWLPEHRLIKVHNATIHNSGYYNCTASNDYGSVTLSYILDIGYPINETVQGSLSYSPGIFTTNYTYLTPHDKSIPYYFMYLLYTYPGDAFYSVAIEKKYYNTALPPTESFNLTLTTTAKYYFTAQAVANKYTKNCFHWFVSVFFTINEENDIVYMPI